MKRTYEKPEAEVISVEEEYGPNAIIKCTSNATYDSSDERFKHVTINGYGDIAYLSRYNLLSDGTLMSSEWDYDADASCLLSRAQYDAAAANGYASLSSDEWTYLLNSRAASTINGVANARFVKCKFQDKRGLLIFPDEFVWPANAGAAPDATAINNASANYDTIIPQAYAGILSSLGCVFLPADGYVTDGSLKSVNVAGNYWTSSTYSASDSYVVDFGSYRSGSSTSCDWTINRIPNSDCVSVRPYFK